MTTKRKAVQKRAPKKTNQTKYLAPVKSVAVTVAVCTHNRFELVKKFLGSARRFSEFKSLRLLLVDNSSDKAEFKKFERWHKKSGLPGEIIVSPRLGLSAARNFALSEATSDFVWFLDDDVTLSDNFLENLATLDFGDYKIVGGKTNPDFEMACPEWLGKRQWGRFSCIDYGDDFRPVEGGEFLVGANIGFHRETALAFGGFDENLGRKGSATLLSNEEVALTEEIKANHPRSVAYCGTLEVHHLVPASRMQQDWLRKRAIWQAVSDALMNEPRAFDLINVFKFVDTLQPKDRSIRSMLVDMDNEQQFDWQCGALYEFVHKLLADPQLK